MFQLFQSRNKKGVAPKANDGKPADQTPDLYQIAENARAKQAKRAKEQLIEKFSTSISKAIVTVLDEGFEDKLLQTAHYGNKSHTLFEIPAERFANKDEVYFAVDAIISYLRKQEEFISKAEKNNTRQLTFKDGTSFTQSPSGFYTSTKGELSFVIEFKPKQENVEKQKSKSCHLL